ncbi:MAG: S-methyl-5'-thioadenosine phosphorylase [Chloroflexi bacterium]|nr:S-methyl-5'-thioadenosine phosphorylase [Chloroflexota bacterium]
MLAAPVLAVIGGSGLYNFSDLKDTQTIEVDTPFGPPSSPITIGKLSGKPVAFLARHGIGHIYPPSEVPYRANIYALKSLGVRRIVSVSACGSLRESYAPGHIVIPNQIFDFTHQRKRSFFETGLVAHVNVADPFCEALSDVLEEAIQETGATYHRGATYITIEGPRFSTKGESNLYRLWDIDIIGMTASPEAFLAREAEICYATMAHVTDYDVWHTTLESVTVEMIVQTLLNNLSVAQQAIKNMVAKIDPNVHCGCEDSLKDAIITNQDHIDPAMIEKRSLLMKKYLG